MLTSEELALQQGGDLVGVILPAPQEADELNSVSSSFEQGNQPSFKTGHFFLFFFFKIFFYFLMWTIFKAFIEFVTILFLFYSFLVSGCEAHGILAP